MDGLPESFERAEWLRLDADEEVLWAGHPSRVPYFPRYVLGGVLVVAGLFGVIVLDEFALLGVVVVAIGFLIAGQAYYGRRSTGYVVTTKQVYHKKGLISREVTQIRYDRIQNTSFSQSVTERLLSYGDVAVTSAGTGEVEILLRSVPAPARIKRMLSERLGAASDGPRLGEGGIRRRNRMGDWRSDASPRRRVPIRRLAWWVPGRSTGHVATDVFSEGRTRRRFEAEGRRLQRE